LPKLVGVYLDLPVVLPRADTFLVFIFKWVRNVVHEPLYELFLVDEGFFNACGVVVE